MAAAEKDVLGTGLHWVLSSLISRITLTDLTNAADVAWGRDGTSYQKLDAVVSKGTFSLLEFCGVDIFPGSPITSHLPFVSSPTPVLLSVSAYLLLVWIWSRTIRGSSSSSSRGKAAAESSSEESAAFKLLVLAHNVFLCLLSLFMGTGILREAWVNRYSIWGNKYNDHDTMMGYLIYIFYMSKLYEFTDTVIILCKRNLRQVSTLHVYHHASIAIIWWIICFRSPVGDSYFSAAFNSWIHVLMYSYYLLAAAIGKNEKLRRRYLFWGKYLTMMQMVQFVSFIGQAAYGIVYPGIHPKGIPQLLFVYSLSLLLLFLDFFLRKHVFVRKEGTKKVKAT